jgi:putative membrane protein
LQEPSASDLKRLHPAAILIWTVESVRSLLLPLIALLLFSERVDIVLLAIPAISIFSAVGRYMRFRYELAGDTLVVQGGLINRYRRVMPVARVQSVDVVEKLRHRITGVVELRVELVGGRQTEMVLSALTPAEAERLGSRLFTESPQADEPRPPLVRLRPVDLLVAGVTGGRVAVLAGIAGYAFQHVPQDTLFDTVEGAVGEARSVAALVLLGVAFFLLLSFGLSVVLTIVVHWDFTVRRDNDRLIVTRGLFERRRSSVPLRRVQAVMIEENLIRRLLGFSSLSLVVAGFAGSQEEQKETRMLLPIAPRDKALELAGIAIGADLEGVVDQLEAPPSRALGRRLVYAGCLGVAAAIVGIFMLRGPGALGILLALPAAGAGFVSYRALGHRVELAFAVVRSGFWVRRIVVVPANNIQHLKLIASPIQRALRLSTVRMHIPRARPAAVDLDRDRARLRFEELSALMLEVPDRSDGLARNDNA